MGRKSYSNPRHEALIPAVYARNMSEAEFYRSILEDNDIPVVIEYPNQNAKTSEPVLGVPVQVPEDYLSEAQDIIEQRHLMDDEIEAEFQEFHDHRDDKVVDDEVDVDVLESEKKDDIDDKDFL